MSLSDALSFAISCLLWGIALLVIVSGALAFAHPIDAKDLNLSTPPAQSSSVQAGL